ncbi:hypothetical protein NM22_04510 [Vibrio tubiashii]|nr:hypothetical protein NM22_04510 [Vibrio tubiashii]
MNKLLIVMALGLFVTFAHAQVTIQTDSRVEILAVNQEINNIPKKAKGDLKIENGVNQLLIRVTGMVDGNGGKKKFNSFPLVVRFEASDQTLKFETPFPIRDERAVNRYKKSPSIKVTSAGQDVSFDTEQIFDQTFAFIKDYDAMLIEYNLSGGAASITMSNKPMHSRVPKQVLGSVQTSGQLSIESTGIKDEYLLMTPTQRQEFISWAVKHINQ